MAIAKFKTEGGQGGKRGHSNMCHWTNTEFLKKGSNKLRRAESKKEIRRHQEE